MNLLVVAFVAGILTALAPCVLPVLPIIVGGSLAGGNDRRRPYIIVGFLALALVLFTLLLKVTTTLLGVPPVVWTIVSATLLVVIGISFIWPHGYEVIMSRFGLYNKAQSTLGKTTRRSGFWGAALVGMALGPVFSSCSPTYALILATVLPASFGLGVVYLVAYALGLATILLAAALLGRRFTSRLGWALNPEGWFKRGLGILFVLIAMAIATGFDKRAETFLTGHQLIDETKIEQTLLPGHKGVTSSNTASKGDANGAQFAIAQPSLAPELKGLTSWLNSSPLTLASLRGKVVLIDFWTYSCINCIHTLPDVESLYTKYKSDGLVVIGVHAPEFAFEHVPANVAQAVKDDHLTYPVALDNDYATWSAYNNQYWPAEYFIDREGNLRHYHFGEGDYQNNELVIRALLAEGGSSIGGSVSTAQQQSTTNHSPETYLGYERASGNANATIVKDSPTNYSYPTSLDTNQWALAGRWTAGAQSSVSGEGASLRYRFSGKQVYLVMGSDTPAMVKVTVNGKPAIAAAAAGADVSADSTVTVSGSRLYRLIQSPMVRQGELLELTFPPSVSVNAFTFD
jgi:cytochrome c biogenesis protein CcdA/thiol-disulfide isomerase/thioredoxin